MTIADKLTQLNSVKTALKNALESRNVNMSGIPFTSYDVKIASLDMSDSVAIPTWTQAEYEASYNAALAANPRPGDWLSLPTLLSTEQKIVCLFAVYEGLNYIAFRCTGAITVDWGDGVVENIATNTNATHSYDYTNAALNGTLTTDGFKQAIITITPQAGQTLSTVTFNIRHPSATTKHLSLIHI